MTEIIEPTEAFPYKPPTEEIKQKYRHIFELTEPLPPRFFKALFDKMVAVVVMLLVSAPILLLLKLAFLVEGWLVPENAGPMFFLVQRGERGQDDSQVQNPSDQDEVHRTGGREAA